MNLFYQFHIPVHNVISIFPGGVREALFGTSLYKVLWGNRSGFAKVAIQARVVWLLCTVLYYGLDLHLSITFLTELNAKNH